MVGDDLFDLIGRDVLVAVSEEKESWASGLAELRRDPGAVEPNCRVETRTPYRGPVCPQPAHAEASHAHRPGTHGADLVSRRCNVTQRSIAVEASHQGGEAGGLGAAGSEEKVRSDRRTSLTGKPLADAQQLRTYPVALVDDHNARPRRLGRRTSEEVGERDLRHDPIFPPGTLGHMSEAMARTDPPFVGHERDLLTAFLDYHRATLMWKCDGLSTAQLSELAVPPSELSLLGLVRHMAEVERSWFRRTLAGEDAPPLYYSDADPDGDFHLPADVNADACFAALRSEWDHSRQLAAGRSLDERAQRARDAVSLRWILIHMIEEYARHNGHADLLRERIDGAKGE